MGAYIHVAFFLALIVSTGIPAGIWADNRASPLINSTVPIALSPLVFEESHLAHRLLDGRNGIEIGAAVQNPFGLRSLNIDLTAAKQASDTEQRRLVGNVTKVDIEAHADRLPLGNGSQEFVVNSHVVEHLYDTIATVEEWMRVLKRHSLLYMIIPHVERTFDRGTRETTLKELIQRHKGGKPKRTLTNEFGHQTIWTLKNFVKLCLLRNWRIVALQNVDDKVGNGFTVVLKKK